MVSTRQMSTSGGSSSSSGPIGVVGVIGIGNVTSASGGVSTTGGSAADDRTPRLSVVTRATQHQHSVNIASSLSSSASALSTVASSVILGAPSMTFDINGTASELDLFDIGQNNVTSVVRRHSHIKQSVKGNDSQQEQQYKPEVESAIVAAGHHNFGGAGSKNSEGFPNSREVINSVGGPLTSVTSSSKLQGQQLMDLPTEILMKILSYVDYKKISQCRLVSSKMNDICMVKLNSTFSKLITTTYNRFHAIKANMPRRESARRNHPLSCECDIIETCYMRLSLLQMTLGKHIERGHCCFFPGAILDEIYTILTYISVTPRLQRPFRVTDELFDLSTMAMEYFRDRIEPTLPGIAYFNKDFYKLPAASKRPALVISPDLADSASNSPPQNHMVLRKGIRKIKQGMKMYSNQLSVLRTDLRNCKRKLADQGKQMAEQQKLIAEQQKQTMEFANRLDENDKKNEDVARKFSTLLQELNKCKTELQFWRSKSPAIPVCITCNQKVTPILLPEDFQADDTDTDSNNENQMTIDEGEFVFPDEATTSKLLAVNMAANNNKRKYQIMANGSNNSSNTNNTDRIIVTPTAGEAEATTSTGNSSSFYNGCCGASTSKAAQQIQNGNGYSTKLFYGNQNQQRQQQLQLPEKQQPQRGGVIVSPISMSMLKFTAPSNGNNNLSNTTKSNVTGAVANTIVATISKQQCNINNMNGNTSAGNGQQRSTINEVFGGGSATAIPIDNEGIVLHETKKARRVQKTTRCVNTNGKRSK